MRSVIALNKMGAMKTGSDLWVCADPLNSTWSQKLDWQLNHQIQKGLAHKSQLLDNQVKGLLYQNQIRWQDLSAANDHLLILSSYQLPARWVLVVPWNGQLDKWIESGLQHWKQLQKPSLRFFLPQNVSKDDFAQSWQGQSDFVDLTVVLD
jgi:hypothetical protein